MPLILGLNAYHGDSSACLVRDGQLVAAAEEERFRRIKHWAGLPTEAIRYCLSEAGVTLSDVDHIALNRRPGVNNWRRLGFVLTHWPAPRLVIAKIRNVRKAASLEDTVRHTFPGETIKAHFHHVEHHLAHLASAFLVSRFDEAVCVSVDGFGDFASAAWGLGRGNQIPVDGRVYFPHSLGIFYSAITQFIGFPHYGDEYKVMGLAPYGQPSYLEQMRQIVLLRPDGTFRLNLKFFRHHNQNVHYTWNDCAPEVGQLYSDRLPELLGPPRQKGEPLDQRHKDLARSAQAMYEEAFFALLDALHAKYRCPNLALAGGCAMNSVANGKVYLRSPFRRMYLPAAAGDAGGAIGAAFVVSHRLNSEFGIRNSEPQNGRFLMSHAYWGPNCTEDALRTLLQDRGLLHSNVGQAPRLSPSRSPLRFDGEEGKVEVSNGDSSVVNLSNSEIETRNSKLETPSSAVRPSPSEFTLTCFSSSDELCARTAQAISEGKVVGWFQGRMEWGPRALGNRSILCDPRRADMKDILNAKIKRRESFRPFAPSILREQVAEWFEQDDDVPFMMQVFQFRPEKRSLVPAVCHVDGSGRLHTVSQEANPLYYSLIKHFFGLTGVPMLLNTSFNENEPVVCRPEEALDCFLRTRMDVLVLGNHFISRK